MSSTSDGAYQIGIRQTQAANKFMILPNLYWKNAQKNFLASLINRFIYRSPQTISIDDQQQLIPPFWTIQGLMKRHTSRQDISMHPTQA